MARDTTALDRMLNLLDFGLLSPTARQMSIRNLRHPWRYLDSVNPSLYAGATTESLMRYLFNQDQQGLWYDASDTSAMFQDVNGLVPISNYQDPVALIMDKRLGMRLGPDIITNSSFAQGSTGWSISGSGTPNWVIADGVASVGVAGSASRYLRWSAGTAAGGAGRVYRLDFDLVSSNGVLGAKVISSTDNPYVAGGHTEPGHYSYYFISGGTNTDYFQIQALTGWSGSITNIRLRQVLGNHAVQATLTRRPTLALSPYNRNVLRFDGIDDYMTHPPVRVWDGATGAASMGGVFSVNGGTGSRVVAGESGAGSYVGVVSNNWYAPYIAGAPVLGAWVDGAPIAFASRYANTDLYTREARQASDNYWSWAAPPVRNFTVIGAFSTSSSPTTGCDLGQYVLVSGRSLSDPEHIALLRAMQRAGGVV